MKIEAAAWGIYLGGELVGTVGTPFWLSAAAVKSKLVESGEYPAEITVREVAGFGTLPTTKQ